MDLVGRDREVSVIRKVLRGSPDCRVLLVTGDAGSGKTFLTNWCIDDGRLRGFTLVGTCLPLSHQIPLLPITEIVRKILTDKRIAAVVSNLPATVIAELNRLSPDFGGQPTSPQDDPAEAAEPRHRRLFGALRNLIHSVASHYSALVIDDLHAADPLTLDFLMYLTATGASPINVISLMRSGATEQCQVALWRERMSRFSDYAELSLGPLNKVETEQQIRLLLGGAVGANLVEHIYVRSGGNPLLTQHLALASRHSTSTASGMPELPDALRRVLSTSIAELRDGPSRDVVFALAVAQRPIDGDSLCVVTARPDRAVAVAVRDLVYRHLVVFEEGVYRLQHGLLAEAAYLQIPEDERSSIHARMAEVLHAMGAHPGEIAEHLAQASKPTQEYSFRIAAGRHDEAVGAYAEAARHWSRSITLWSQRDRTTPDEVDLATIYLRAVEDLELSGNSAGAARLAENAGDRLLQSADAATAGRLHLAISHFRGIYSADAAIVGLMKAIELLEQAPPSLEYVRALRRYGGLLRSRGDFSRWPAFAERALAVARQLNLRSQVKPLLAELSYIHALEGDIVSVENRLNQARLITLAPLERRAILETAAAHTGALVQIGRLEAAAEAGLDALTAANAVDSQTFMASVVRWTVYQALSELGRMSDLERLVLCLTDDTNISHDALLTHLASADFLLHSGNLKDAGSRWKKIIGPLRSTANVQVQTWYMEKWLDFHVIVGSGIDAVQDTWPAIKELADTDQSQLMGPLLVVAMRACANEAQRARARSDQAALRRARLTAELVDATHSRMHIDPLIAKGPAAIAESATFSAERARLMGRPSADEWRQTAELWTRLNRPHRVAYALIRCHEADIDIGNNAPATLLTAATWAQGHEPLAAVIRALAARCRIRLPDAVASAPRVKPARPFGLTDREAQVLVLVAAGLTNRQIGERLVISPRTADVHVRHLLEKLDVENRTQLATVAGRAGLLADQEII